MHENSIRLFERYCVPEFRAGMRVLEIGPDAFPSSYRRLAGSELDWDTLDINDNESLTYPGSDPYAFPIPNDSYDVILAGQVIEHVPMIWRWMREVARICRKGGLVMTIVPASWPFHEEPVDCWRAYPDGMRALYEDSGLELMMSKCESLEGGKFRNRIAGMSYRMKSWKWRLLYETLGPIGFPVECAFDTVTIGRKPVGRESIGNRRGGEE